MSASLDFQPPSSSISPRKDTTTAATTKADKIASLANTISPLSSPSSNVRKFDPFLPLSPPGSNPAFSQRAPSPSAGGTSARFGTSSPPDNDNSIFPPPISAPANLEGAALNSTSSLQRENRPTSLYIPLTEGDTGASASGNTPTWPFTRTGAVEGETSGDELLSSRFEYIGGREHGAITTPSAINPAFGLRPDSPPYAGSASGGGGATARSPSPRIASSATVKRDLDPSMSPPNLKRDYSTASVASTGTGPGSHFLERRPSVAIEFSASPSPTSGGFASSTILEKSFGTPASSSSLYSLPVHTPGSVAGASRPASPSSFAQTYPHLAAQLDTPTAWLCYYFAFNLGLTLYNKLVLQGFPFPWTLTGIQMLSGTLGTQIALQRGYFVQANLSRREGFTMIAFSGLYTVNIAVSNLSLHLVTVPFHQVVRAMTPLFTIIIAAILFRKQHSQATYISLIPVVVGVIFATYGDYNFTTWGLILTLIGTLLAALKTIVTNKIQVGRLKLHPLDLLIRMSPLAFMQCVLWSWYSGELANVRTYSATEMTRSKATALLVNGMIAFGLNVVSFTANKKTSALTMTVAANVKQVLTIVLAVVIFNLKLNLMNTFGITCTLAGGAWYARIELQEKANRANTTTTSDEARRTLLNPRVQ